MGKITVTKSKIFFTIALSFLCSVLTFFAIFSLHCNQTMELSPLIVDNQLNNKELVYQFILENVEISRETTEEVIEFTEDSLLTCYELGSRPTSLPNRLLGIDFNHMLTCTVFVYEPSFINKDDNILERLSMCYFTPLLRIHFLFDNDILIDVKVDIIL